MVSGRQECPKHPRRRGPSPAFIRNSKFPCIFPFAAERTGRKGYGGVEHFAHMPPIHADEVNGTIGTDGTKAIERGSQELREVALAHSAGRHREVAMPALQHTYHGGGPRSGHRHDRR